MSARPAEDRCPGVLRTFAAADGALIRLRSPGGRVPTSTLVRLAEAAARFGAPFVQLTSRANLQLRGLPDVLPDALTDLIDELGLLPSQTHERVRNIIAAPLGLHEADVMAAVRELDLAIIANPTLAHLPGRFLAAIDDEHGLLRNEPVDLGYRVHTAHSGVLFAAGGRFELPIAREHLIQEIVTRASTYVALREASDTPAWSTLELPEDSPMFAGMTRVRPVRTAIPDSGVVGDDLLVAVPGGLLTVAQARALQHVRHSVRLTPWRRIVLPEVAGRDVQPLTASGLSVSRSAWDRVTTCIGAPYCARTNIDTLAIATGLVARSPAVGPSVHVSGCDRRCGHPSSEFVDVLEPVSVDEVLAELDQR